MTHQLVQKESCAMLEVLFLQLFGCLQVTPETIEDRNFSAMQRNEEIRTHENIYLLLDNTTRFSGSVGNVKHQKQIRVVLLYFWSLMFT